MGSDRVCHDDALDRRFRLKMMMNKKRKTMRTMMMKMMRTRTKMMKTKKKTMMSACRASSMGMEEVALGSRSNACDEVRGIRQMVVVELVHHGMACALVLGNHRVEEVVEVGSMVRGTVRHQSVASHRSMVVEVGSSTSCGSGDGNGGGRSMAVVVGIRHMVVVEVGTHDGVATLDVVRIQGQMAVVVVGISSSLVGRDDDGDDGACRKEVVVVEACVPWSAEVTKEWWWAHMFSVEMSSKWWVEWEWEAKSVEAAVFSA